MVQHRGRQGEWPVVRREPDACIVAPDGYQKTDRGAAGTLRFGTAVDRVGPSGRNPAETDTSAARTSDYGMDKAVHREFDPMGTSIDRYRNNRRDSGLVSSAPAPRTMRPGSGRGRPERGPPVRGAGRRSDRETT